MGGLNLSYRDEVDVDKVIIWITVVISWIVLKFVCLEFGGVFLNAEWIINIIKYI